MKIINKLKLICIAIIILGTFIALSNIVNAAGSFSVSAGNKNLQINGTTQLSITTTGCAGKFSVSSSNSSVVSVSTSETFVDGTSMTPSITLTAKSAGSATITITASDVLDPEYNEVTGSKTVSISVVNPAPTPTPTQTPTQTGGNGGNSNSSGNQNTSTTTQEPTFKSVNKTVYSVGDINLRASWSTSSQATRVIKDTEMTLTGTSTEKINGYVWYRVEYKGQTKYVSRDLVTETKPETEEKEPEKSNNNNLKLLEISAIEIDPKFDKDVLEYTAKIENYKEKELNVKAEAEDEKATVKIEGNNDIRIGENKIVIRVTAEDGTEKLYTITLNNEKTDAFGLSTLKIKNVDLKGFSTEKYEYSVKFTDLNKLEIQALANEEGATIEILGNENLKEGENIITIIVTSKDGQKSATYQIKAIKSVAQATKTINYKNLAICAALALFVLILIITLIVNYLKNKNDYLEEENGYSSDFENNNQLQNEEINEEVIEDNDYKEVENDEIIQQDNNDDDDDDKKRGKGKHSR